MNRTPHETPRPCPANGQDRDLELECYEVKPIPRSANILIASPRNSTILGW